jgi:serine/threonine protein kinase
MLGLSKGHQLANRYTLIRKIGDGGEARLWLAKDRLTAATVALKITSKHKQSAARLRLEWQTNIRLMHAHILRAFEFHAEAELSFFSQQFVDGPNIGALSGFSPAEVLAPIGLIADALRYVHSKGIVHRDIKAANVLLDHNGSPYLADFGVAVAVGSTASGGSLIAQSPQSLRGQSAQTSDDIFALGVLIYELIAGQPPFSSVSLEDAIRDQLAAPLQAADGSDLPPALVDLVARMLHKDAAYRPDAEAVVTGLADAGFSAGAASIRSGRSKGQSDERVEAVTAIRAKSTDFSVSQRSERDAASGISRQWAAISLFALVSILVAVVVILPSPGSQDDLQPGPSRAEAALPPVSPGDARARDIDERPRSRGDRDLPVATLDDEVIEFNENRADYSGLDEEERARFNAEATLGELLSALEILEGRAVERWAPLEYRQAKNNYAAGDQLYLKKDFVDAEGYYSEALTALEPLYERIQPTFDKAYADAMIAFDAGERLEALRLFELAVAITPTHRGAVAGYTRARNLEAVLGLVERGIRYEENLELLAAQASFERAVDLDSLWQPAHDGVARVKRAILEMEFDQLMSDGIEAIAGQDYLGARAAFRVAQRLIPESPEPADGLLQVSQALQLQQISLLEQEALSLEINEHWDAVVTTYDELIKIDNTLSFAANGLSHAREMSALHGRLDALIEEPDLLSAPATMRSATRLLIGITGRSEIGPRLGAQRDELSRLLKRAVTPLTIPLISDNVTDVSIYKVGRLGNFMRTEVSLRPGTYVAVGIRSGYRDVREEFRVAPEVAIEPVIIRCEEPI